MTTVASTRTTDIHTHLSHVWAQAYADRKVPTTWTRTRPEMRGMSCLEQLRVAMGPHGPLGDHDAVWLELIARAQDGDEAAGWLLLMRLQPRCRQLYRTVAWRTGTSTRRGDVPADVTLECAWEAIATYPLTCSTRVRTNLSMRVLNRTVLAAPETSEDATSPTDLVGIINGLGTRRADPATGDPSRYRSLAREGRRPAVTTQAARDTGETVAELLLWALDHAVVTRDEAALVYRATVAADTSTKAALAQIAHEQGVTTRAMQYRFSAAVASIREAVRTSL